MAYQCDKERDCMFFAPLVPCLGTCGHWCSGTPCCCTCALFVHVTARVCSSWSSRVNTSLHWAKNGHGRDTLTPLATTAHLKGNARANKLCTEVRFRVNSGGLGWLLYIAHSYSYQISTTWRYTRLCCCCCCAGRSFVWCDINTAGYMINIASVPSYIVNKWM